MITIKLPPIGSDLEDIGFKTTHQWITGIIFAGFVVVGLAVTKLRLTISNQEQHKILLTPIIFSLHMGGVTITRVVKG